MFCWFESLGDRREVGGVSGQVLELSFLVALVPPRGELGAAACLGSFFAKYLYQENTKCPSQKVGFRLKGMVRGCLKPLEALRALTAEVCVHEAWGEAQMSLFLSVCLSVCVCLSLSLSLCLVS